MNEIYVAHEIIFNKNFNSHKSYHGNLSGCQFDNQYLVSKEVVLLTVNKQRELCYLSTMRPCHIITPSNLQKSFTLFECRYCSNQKSTGANCNQIALLKSEKVGVINVMPISEFTKIGYIPVAINLVNEYNDSVKGEFVPITDKDYVDTIVRINSGFTRIRTKKEN